MSAFHHSKKWKATARAFRRRCIEKDMYVCRKCGADGRYLRVEVDHVKPLRFGGRGYDFKNLQMLCADCHREKSRSEIEEVDSERRKWIELLEKNKL